MKRKLLPQVDMTSGRILPNVIAFAIPLIITSYLQLLYNAADLVVVGKWAGDACLAAVGATGSTINLLLNVFLGLSVGAGVVLPIITARRIRMAATEPCIRLFLSLLSAAFSSAALP